MRGRYYGDGILNLSLHTPVARRWQFGWKKPTAESDGGNWPHFYLLNPSQKITCVVKALDANESVRLPALRGEMAITCVRC